MGTMKSPLLVVRIPIQNAIFVKAALRAFYFKRTLMDNTQWNDAPSVRES